MRHTPYQPRVPGDNREWVIIFPKLQHNITPLHLKGVGTEAEIIFRLLPPHLGLVLGLGLGHDDDVHVSTSGVLYDSRLRQHKHQ